VPTAAAFEGLEAAAVQCASWLGAAGLEVEALMAQSRTEAELGELAARAAAADVIVLSDGSALHLRTTLRATALLAGIVAARARGALLVAIGAAAAAICDPMVDPRGGAPTVGLGLLEGLVVVPGASLDHLGRSLELVDPSLTLVELPMRAALELGPSGPLAYGEGVVAHRGGELVELGELGLP
jgi:cyanophycinase